MEFNAKQINSVKWQIFSCQPEQIVITMFEPSVVYKSITHAIQLCAHQKPVHFVRWHLLWSHSHSHYISIYWSIVIGQSTDSWVASNKWHEMEFRLPNTLELYKFRTATTKEKNENPLHPMSMSQFHGTFDSTVVVCHFVYARSQTNHPFRCECEYAIKAPKVTQQRTKALTLCLVNTRIRNVDTYENLLYTNQNENHKLFRFVWDVRRCAHLILSPVGLNVYGVAGFGRHAVTTSIPCHRNNT